MASSYRYTDFGSTFGESFVEGLLGMMRIGVERDRLEADTENRRQELDLRRAQDARLAEAHNLEMRRNQYALDEQQQLPGDIASIYQGAAAQPGTPSIQPTYGLTPQATLGPVAGEDYSLDMLQPGAPAVPGREPAMSYSDLISRGVSPNAIARVQRLAPGSVSALGLQTPEQAADYKRKSDAREQAIAIMQSPMPEDLNEQGLRLGQLTGVLFRGGFIQGPDAIKDLQAAWQNDPAAAKSFFDNVGARLRDSANKGTGASDTAARLREAFAGALADDPTILLKNPALVKSLGLDKILQAPSGAGPKTVTPLPANSPGAIVDNTFVPSGVQSRGTAWKVNPVTGEYYNEETGAVRPGGPAVSRGQPRDPIDVQTQEYAVKRWPNSIQAQNRFLEAARTWRASIKNRFPAPSQEDSQRYFAEAEAASDRVAAGGSATKPEAAEPQGGGFWDTVGKFFSSLTGRNTGAATPRGRPGGESPVMQPGAPIGGGRTAPMPETPGIPPVTAPGGAAPPVAAPAPGPVAAGPGPAVAPNQNQPVQANPPPSRAYTEQDKTAEMQRIGRLILAQQPDIPPLELTAKVRAAMKAAGW